MRRKTFLKSSLIAASLCLTFAVAGCTPKSHGDPVITYKNADVAKQDVMTYKANAKTRYIVSVNGADTDITENVTNYNRNNIYINQNALKTLFGMEKMAVSESTKNDFEGRIKAKGLESSNGEYYSFQNSEHSLLFKENSKVYVFDDVTCVFQDSAVKVNTNDVSIPLMDLIFNFGYDNVASKVEDNTVTYTIGTNIDTNVTAAPEQEMKETDPTIEGETIPAPEITEENQTDITAEQGPAENAPDAVPETMTETVAETTADIPAENTETVLEEVTETVQETAAETAAN